MQLKPGTTLQNGKYEIIRPLGQGGFGITYVAEQVALNREVAIKEFFMKEYCERDDSTSQVTLGTTAGNRELVTKFREKFVREARMIARLDHPNVVKIYDVFEENGTAYYVMEYIANGSLKELIAEQGAIDEKTALKYIAEAGEALRYVHDRKILHFDVKPSNIMLRDSGSTVLIDFGVSKHFDESGHVTSSTPVGISKGYAPLEQYRQEDISTFTPATDIYSLGATLYTLVTGAVPPDASEVYEDGIPQMSSKISKTTRAAIVKAMSPKRKDRPQDVESFLRLLGLSMTVPKKPVQKSGKKQGSEETVITDSSRLKKALEQKKIKEEKEREEALRREEERRKKELEKEKKREEELRKKELEKEKEVPKAVFVPSQSGKKPKSNEITELKPEPKPRKPFPWKPVVGAAAGLLVTLLVFGLCSRHSGSNFHSEEQAIEVVAVEEEIGNQTETPAVEEVRENPVEENKPETGSLQIGSTPSGAQIWIDGSNTGKKTPATIDQLTPDNHKVELKMDGYESMTADIRITAGKTNRSDLTLSAIEKPKVKKVQNGNKTTFTLLDSNVSFTMVSIPGGTFMMGAPDDDPDAADNEKPAHSVTVKSFSIGETEVPQSLWNAVMGNNPSVSKGDNLPVENVTRNNCLSFIKKLNELTGCSFRLPKEAEWEFAARGGTNSGKTKYSGGNSLSQTGWYDGNSGGHTHPVRQKTPNSLGLYDMSGNVWEWCQERFVGTYSSTASDATISNGYVIRGGSWDNFDSSCRVSSRNRSDSSDSRIGFRIAM